MKKTSKIIAALCVILTIVMIGVSSFATTITPSSFTAEAPSNVDTITSIGGKIIGIIRTAGVLIAVVILLILGIQYMIGSAEQKADYKKSMVPYIVGAVLLFGASAIAGIVYDLATSLETSSR